MIKMFMMIAHYFHLKNGATDSSANGEVAKHLVS